MSEPRKGKTLTIKVRIRDGSYSLELEGYGQRTGELPDLGDTDRLRTMRRAAMADLTRFKKAAVTVRPDTYHGFNELAMKLMGQLLGDRVNQYLSIFYDFVSECFLKWYASEDATPHVTLEAPAESMMPIELLAFDTVGRPPASSAVDPGYYNHLGFASVVNRSFSRVPDLANSRIIQNVPQLPIMFLRNSSLKGSNDEAQFLTQDRRIRVDGPWPSKAADILAGPDAVIDSLYDPFRYLDGTRASVAAQIQHLSCHGRFNAQEPDQSELRLGCSDGTVRILLSRLTAKFAKQRLRTKEPTRDVPLVFLNACESAAAAGYMSADSFPRHFRDWDSRAVLGSETVVPDVMAASFSRLFYQGLLDSGLSVGEAVLPARQRLLERNNPIGILYTLYGDPDLIVQLPGRRSFDEQ